jgi:hypothetical protein
MSDILKSVVISEALGRPWPGFTRCNTNGRDTQAQLDCLNERYEICLRKVRHPGPGVQSVRPRHRLI